MKKQSLVLLLGLAALGLAAQAQQPTEEMMRQYRATVQKRDISQRHTETGIPLSATTVPTTKGNMKGLPEDRVWFPGEWEEVQAIVVTPYYTYAPVESQGTGYWIADPLVSGWAQYYHYTGSNWREQGMGPYTASMDTTSTFGNVSFYLMDAIQLGGAEAWVRLERWADSSTVLRKLARMGLRHDKVRFMAGGGNSFWYRDCGPICFYYGDQDSVAMLDFTYYPGRALDDSLPTIIHNQMGLPNYITNVEWEGGNCLVDGAGMVFSSDQIYSTNADQYGQLTWNGTDVNTINYQRVTPLSQSEVKQALHDLLGQRATHILPAYQYDGGTGHIDLYADMWEENSFVFSVMPDVYSRWTDYQTGSRNIDSLCSYKSVFDRPYTMTSIPFPSDDNGNDFASQASYNNNYTRTYSNHTFVNNVIMQPCFSPVVNGEPSATWDKANIEQMKAAYPGYTIYPVDVREFDGSGGAIHCITKQIPADNPMRILHKRIQGTIGSAHGRDLPVSAIITNRSGIAHAEVVYRVDGGEWQTINLAANGNRHYGILPLGQDSLTAATVEYYISATSNNGKTMAKPITAAQGGYFSFTLDGEASAAFDSAQFDYDTLPMPADQITFTFGNSWVTEDHAGPLDIQEGGLEEAFGQFYPNPASTEASLRIDLASGSRYTVSIIDVAGRTVHTSTLDAMGSIVYTINASRLAAGQYTVVFRSEAGAVARKLLVR